MDEIEYRKRVINYINVTKSSQPEVLGVNAKMFELFFDDKDFAHLNTNYFMDNSCLKEKCMADSGIFVLLFMSLQFLDSHYVTAINDLFNRETKEYYIPRLVPVLEKFVRNNEHGVYGEVVGSRLAHLMGYDTVFNIAPTHDVTNIDYNKPTCDNESERLKRKAVLSVDMIAEGWDHYTFNVIMGGRGARQNNSIQQNLNMIESILPLVFKSKTGIILSNEQIKNIQSAYVSQYLFRKVLCGDTDFYARNSGIMYNLATSEVRLLPNFDMECCFETNKIDNDEHLSHVKEMQDTISFCLTNYPNELNTFLAKITQIMYNGELEHCLTTSLKTHKQLIAEKVDFVHKQIALIEEFCLGSIKNYIGKLDISCNDNDSCFCNL